MAKSSNHKVLNLLQQAFDALINLSDSELDMFDDETEEFEAAPEQYACRKIMEAMDIIRAENREQLLHK